MSKKRNKKRRPSGRWRFPTSNSPKRLSSTLLPQKVASAAMIAPSQISLIGTAQNLGSRSTVQSSCGTGSISNRSSTLPRQSISVWLLSVAGPMKRPTPVSSARSWLPEFAK